MSPDDSGETGLGVPRHVSDESDPRERGRGFGEAQREAVRHTLATYRRMFDEDRGLGAGAVRAIGADVRAVVGRYRPAACLELEGLAEGAAVDADELFAANARSEILSGGRVSGAIGAECSTLALTARDRSRAVLAQTWDFHPSLRPSRVVWTRMRPDGFWSTTFTEAGLLAKVGVNAHGIALALNFMSTDRDGARGGAGGVPVHVLTRTVLEEARTVEEARRLVELAPAAASACLTVAGPDAAGDVVAASLERWPGGVGVHMSPKGSFAHTNHFLTPIEAADAIRRGPGGVSTAARLAVLRSALADASDAPGALDVATVERILSSESADAPASIWRRDDASLPWLERNGTLATLAFELPAAVMWLRTADDPAAPLQRVPLAPARVG